LNLLKKSIVFMTNSGGKLGLLNTGFKEFNIIGSFQICVGIEVKLGKG